MLPEPQLVDLLIKLLLLELELRVTNRGQVQPDAAYVRAYLDKIDTTLDDIRTRCSRSLRPIKDILRKELL